MLLGRLAVHFKILTKEQLGAVAAQQGRLQEPVPIGQTMVAMELISQEQLASLLKAREQYLENQRKKAGQAPSPAAQAVPATPTQQDRVAKPSADPAGVPTNGVVANDHAAASNDAAVRLWNVENGKLVHRLPHDEKAFCVAFGPSGITLLAGGGAFPLRENHAELRLWNPLSGTIIREFDVGNKMVVAAAFIRGGKYVVTAG